MHSAAWDLILTDLTMPGMAGTELAETVQKTRPDLPVILCTGFNDTITDEDLEKTNIQMVLEKPFTIRELSMGLRKVLD